MHRDEALQCVTETIRRLTDDPAAWAQWARTLSRFHKYSYQKLIWSQAPKATHVAGYQAWKHLGRFVRRGEYGISILAPIRRNGEEPTFEEELARDVLEIITVVRRGFTAVGVPRTRKCSRN